MRWAGHVARMGERKGVYIVLGGGNLRERGHLEDPDVDGNIKKGIQEVGCGGLDWLDLAQDRECGNEPSGSIKCGEFLD